MTFGEVFTVQPFQNPLVTMNLTGAQIDTLSGQPDTHSTPFQRPRVTATAQTVPGHSESSPQRGRSECPGGHLGASKPWA